MATYLKNHRGTLAQATVETATQAELAIDFYNTCHLAGIIKASAYDTNDVDPVTVESMSVLGKIKKRLRR